MNTPDEFTEPTKIDEYQDRVIDRGLTELIGNETPPDLSGRILSAAVASMPAPVEHSKPKRFAASRWVAVAVAASLLVGATLLAILPIGTSQMAAKEAAKRLGLATTSQSGRLGGQTDNTPLSGATTNDGIELESTDASLLTRSVDQRLTPGETPLHTVEVRFGDAKELKKSLELSSQLADQTASNAIGVNGRIKDANTSAPTSTTAPADGLDLYSFHDRAARVPAAAEPSLDARLQVADGWAEAARGLNFGANQRRGGEVEMDVAAVGDVIAEVPQLQTAEGIGPDLSGDQYTRIVENPFIKAEGANAVSTFSIDVDTASYANVRQFLMDMNALPPPDAVRIEELVNYFDYDYAGPPANATDAVDTADADTPPAPGSAGGPDDAAASNNHPAPFAAHVEIAGCPWKTEHRLVRIGIKGRELERDKRPRSNLVFLVDVSGSMDEPNKLPLVVYGLEQLTRELGENDRVAIVVYANSEGLVLPSTVGSDQRTILAALGQLQAGGSTAGGAGIQLAYQIAEDNFVKGGTNRVILCTDGDFNVGVTSTAELERLCEQKAKDTGVFLSVLGFGRGNLNDAMMEAIADHGNGNYHYIDNRTEARRVLVEEMTGTLVTIAKDVKIQVEFNPRQVAGYRLIGYENRMLRTEDFNDDTKDAGEIGAGHTVTALYEIVPAGQKVDVPPVDELKYQSTASNDSKSDPSASGDVASELLTLKMRYKQPEGDTSRKLDWAITDEGQAFRAASGDFQFAAAVAGFGLLLRDSQYKGNLTFAAVVELAQSGLGKDEHGYRAEFLEIVRRAAALRGE